MQRTLIGARTGTRLSIVVMLLAAFATSALGASGNYLIVTPQAYAGSAPLLEFANAKTAMGYMVSFYTVLPGTSRSDIKAHIEDLWDGVAPPDYVLIIGDTDGTSATANTIPHWVGQGSRQGTTDLPYACMDGGDDWYPDLCIGRFSVRTVQQLQAAVDKTLCVEAGNFSDPDYVLRGAFLANSGTQGMAEPSHDWVIENLFEPNDYVGMRLYAVEGAGTGDVSAAVNAGCLWTVYYGHSGSSGWWEPSFNQSNVNALTNEGLYGLAMGWSCNTAHFDYDECFGETWLRKANAGAAAYLSASNYIWWGSVDAWESSTRMERYFFEAIFDKGIWQVGPAWQSACYTILADPDFGPTHDHTRNIFEEFVLLGDPSLRLPQPDGFAVVPTPAAHDVCAPPTVSVDYIIEVAQLGDFAEPVTLSVAGLPAGVLAEFSVNSVVPPFTSVLTVSDLEVGAAGEYVLEVAGVSATLERAAVVGLGLGNDVPDVVALLSPADGALDVARAPTLSWQDLPDASVYDLEIATDPAFTYVTYARTLGQASHVVEENLDADQQYFWRVRAANGCGESDFSATFNFTTIAQQDYFTQQFSSGFDLEYTTITLIPDGSGDYYDVCGGPADTLPTDPAGGTSLSLSDDGSQTVSPSTPVWIYNSSFAAFYVNANGNITFNGSDGTYNESLDVHFNQPRVSALFDDLNPASGGQVSWRETADRVAITWDDVPEYSSSNSNTFQIELFFDGEIRLTWLQVDSNDSIVGLSAGGGIPDDYLVDDLSAVGWCPGDMNCDGLRNSYDIDPFVLALTDPDGYAETYPGCALINADCDGDGYVNSFDIDPFTAMLTGE